MKAQVNIQIDMFAKSIAGDSFVMVVEGNRSRGGILLLLSSPVSSNARSKTVDREILPCNGSESSVGTRVTQKAG